MQKKFISLQTKVSKATNERFQECARRAGLKSGYELMQILVTAFLRVADPEHEPIEEEVEETEQRAQWATIFADWLDATKRLNTAKPQRERTEKLDEAVLMFRQPGTTKHSVRRVTFRDEEPMFIGRDVDGTINAMLRKLRPETATALLEIGRACGTNNLCASIDALIEDTNIPRIKEDGQGFGQGLTQDYGAAPQRRNKKQFDK